MSDETPKPARLDIERMIQRDMERMLAHVQGEVMRKIIEVQPLTSGSQPVYTKEPENPYEDAFKEFLDSPRHPRAAINWLLKNLDFSDDDDSIVNNRWCSDAASSTHGYLTDLNDWGLEYTEEEQMLHDRLELLGDLTDCLEGGLDWKAVRRLLEGVYDDDLRKDKVPFALSRGERVEYADD